MASSVPLAEPWNGADKLLAGLLVRRDEETRFTVHTSEAEPWPLGRVRAVRSPQAGAMPTTGQRVRTLGFLARHGGSADVLHLVASLNRPSSGKARLLRACARAVGTPLLHSMPSSGDAPASADVLPGDLSVVFSEHGRRRLEAAGIADVERLDPPVELERLRPRTDPAELVRELQLGPRAVLCATHYGPQSGIAELVRAFAALPEDLDDVVLVLALRHHREQDPAVERRRVERWADEAGVGRRIRLLHHVPDMPALIAACATTVLVAEALGAKQDLPLVILETLALGRPVVVGDRPPLSESLLGSAGRRVPPGDVEALTDALGFVLEDAERASRLGATGRASVLERCTPDRVIERYRELYERLADGRNGS